MRATAAKHRAQRGDDAEEPGIDLAGDVSGQTLTDTPTAPGRKSAASSLLMITGMARSRPVATHGAGGAICRTAPGRSSVIDETRALSASTTACSVVGSRYRDWRSLLSGLYLVPVTLAALRYALSTPA
jgi:hypothetical protein